MLSTARRSLCSSSLTSSSRLCLRLQNSPSRLSCRAGEQLKSWPARHGGAPFATLLPRAYVAGSNGADEYVEKITDAYETAVDEFQIATEETEENTIYAEDDRAAAQTEIKKLKELYASIVENKEIAMSVREEVKRRTHHRIRELDNAIKALEEKAMSHD